MKRKHQALIAAAVLGIGLITATTLSRRARFETAAPKRETILEAIYGLGKVKSNRRYEVKVGVLSSVQRIPVKEGQAVRKGDLLMAFETGGSFRAPFPGTVTKVAVSEQEAVAPNTPVLRLEDLNDTFIEVALEQQGALRVRSGQKATISLESLRGKKYEGKITSVFSREDEFLAHIEVANLPDSVLPGMTADVAIEVGTKENALLVPINAVNDGQVIREREGKRQKVTIEVGAVDGQWAEIIQGDVKESDQVVIPVSPGKPAK